ncbi:MAG: nucleotide sugar dehydrogenase, partial [Anaerolineae bacterium]|nr:nucleotide sugar dehydrogenase [Anaerolineae bacterium]
MKRICVLGLGYVGLPTAAMLATHGNDIVGVDVSRRVLDTLNNGDVHIKEAGLRSLVRAALRSGNLRLADRPEPADAFIIAVPTPFVENPQPTADLASVISAAEAIVPYLEAGNLVILESTVPPRTTEEVLVPVLRRSGIEDLLVAHCPERVLPGRILAELVGNDRVIGGVDRRSAEAARELYASFVEGEMLLTDATTAEMVKLMENTYRDVNIALANEFALVAEEVGIDVWEAIDLANRHPRVRILRPGPGVGGHCIAVDPWFVAEAAPDVTPLIQAARRVNDAMPAHVVDLVKRAVAGVEKPVIACLGLAYKADVDDVRESPALKVV